MSSSIFENCLSTINKAKTLSHLNMFITNTFDLAVSQAKKRETKEGNSL
jgi:hypothetical protein